MTISAYPATLPPPHEVGIDPAERRRLSDMPGVLSAAGKWRDFGGTQGLRFVFTRAQLTTFNDWLRNDINNGGAWFAANWRQPNGVAGGVRRFTAPPASTHTGNIGDGVWTVEATVEIRGVPGVTTEAPGTPTGTLIQNVVIPKVGGGGNWASVCDVYIPDDVVCTSVSVWLHGGKGSKESFARNLGIVTGKDPAGQNVIKWDLLKRYKTIAVIPMGQFCAGVFDATWNPNSADTTAGGTKPGVRTWSNGFMYSGQDDPQMLADLADLMTATYPGKTLFLAGHSNGGFMTQRMWLERPTKYARYAAASGPMSFALSGTPATTRPMLSLIGGIDATINVTDGPAGPGSHFFDPVWIQGSEQYSVANVQLPHPGYYRGEYTQFLARVAAWAVETGLPQTVQTKREPVKEGYTTTYFTNDVRMVLQLVENAGHYILGRPDLDGPSMQQCLGRRFLSVAMTFFQRA